MKKLLPFLLVLLCCWLVSPRVSAAEPPSGLVSLEINPYGGEEDSIDTIHWHEGEETYYFFLPADTDPALARVYFEAGDEVALDEVVLISGETAAAFTEGVHSLRCGEETCMLTVCRSADLPAVFLATESGSLDYIHANKENREPGSIRVYENGVMTLDKPLQHIKGRGNATWFYAKKPYNIKFDKKTDLFGMGKAKKWTLLANYIDHSLIHNAYGWEFASAFGMQYTSAYRYIDLYINGDYLGNYVICESVEVGETRIDISDLEKANENANPDTDIESLPQGGTGPNNTVQRASVRGSRKWIEIPEDPADISGGYLMEMEIGSRYNTELCGFVTQSGQPIVLKSPEYATKAEVNYIADLMDAAYEALLSPTGRNAAGNHYSDYLDVDSLARAYILQELSMNYDAGTTSFFAFKPAGEGKIVFAPVWDMDNAFGILNSNLDVPLNATYLWWANQITLNGVPTVLTIACRHADFRAVVKEIWAELEESGAFETVNSAIDALTGTLRESAAMNALRWGRSDSHEFEASAAWWEEKVLESTEFVSARTEALGRGFGPDGAYLGYDLNGVTGGSSATVSPISCVGETVAVRDVYQNSTVTAPAGKVFFCWNTAPDGSGRLYFPGDPLTLTEEGTILYAIWKTPSEINPFRDVTADAWYYEAVVWAYNHAPQITAGTSQTRFSPLLVCTREQVVTFLWKAAGAPEPELTESPFRDVDPSQYYYKAVLWAAENGVTNGVGGKRFGVGMHCTREQVVTFLWKAAGAPEPVATDNPFRDVDAEQYYYKAVLWAAENGVTSGIGGRRFGVGAACTRGQIVTLLYKAREYLE